MAADHREVWTELLARLSDRAAVAARYDVGLEIAHGGMGTVFEVHDPDLRRRLAMKVLRVEPTDDAVARFLEEAQIAAQLDHPGIVPIHELGVDSAGRVYFTMKRVVGDDLREVFRKVRTGDDGWNQTRVLGVLQRVCEAMAFAHSRNVVHRDLKPGNIMVGRFGETYVMDWGLAHVLDAQTGRSAVHTDRHDLSASSPESPLLTKAGDVLGTAPYMPPEQASGRPDHADPRADVYAMGAILYELLSGHAPYLDQPQPAVLERVVGGPPTPLVKLAPRAPAELLAICNTAMARAVRARYQTMQALGDDLRAYLENRVVVAYRTGPLAELRKWVRRNKAVAATAGILLLVAASAGYIIAAAARREAAHLRLTADLREVDMLLDATPTRAEVPAWLERARRLVARSGDYKRQLAALRAQATWLDDAQWSEQQQRHPDFEELRQKQERAELNFTPRLAQARAALAATGTTADERLDAAREVAVLEAELALLAQQTRMLRARIEHGRWQLNGAAAIAYDRLVELVSDLDQLTDPDTGRLPRYAKSLERDAHADAVAADAWPAAIAAIADRERCPRYAGLTIRPQSGLVPLGVDAESGLWEFWHPASGERPERAADGRLLIAPDTGLVFVLVPGGRVWIGATLQPGAPNFDPKSEWWEREPIAISLEPYLLSKYEMTQGQWIRATADNPSMRFAGMDEGRLWTRVHPIELVTWFSANQELRRLGLRLPTEAQFERAMRGGTTTACWWGDDYDDRRELRANCWEEAELRDGHIADAPVDSFEPNPFGFYCIAGNVWEWCDDWSVPKFADATVRALDGRLDAPLASKKTLRGGGFRGEVSYMGCARRMPESPHVVAADYGVRPARDLER